MYTIINSNGQVYNGSMSDTRHYWEDTGRLHFHAVLFPLQEEAEDINRILGVEGTKVIPISELK